MREYALPSLILLCISTAAAQTAPADWKVVRDAKSACQISVPAEWTLLDPNSGAAVFQNVSTGIAVVTAQPAQEFKPLTPYLLKVLGVSQDKLFENTVKRIFYQDKTSQTVNDLNAFTASVPSSGGTCSCHLVATRDITEEVAKKIVLSLSPAADKSKS